MKIIGQNGIFTILEDVDGKLWAQPPDSLPPLRYFVSNSTAMLGLDRTRESGPPQPL